MYYCVDLQNMKPVQSYTVEAPRGRGVGAPLIPKNKALISRNP